jgi:hypothetical protein
MEEEEVEEEVEKAERAMEVEARAEAPSSPPPPPSSKLRARAKEEWRAERLWEDWGMAVPVVPVKPAVPVPVAAARDASRGGSVPLGASHTMEKVLVCGEKDRARAGRHRALPSPAKSKASAPHPAATQSSPLWESSSMSTK